MERIVVGYDGTESAGAAAAEAAELARAMGAELHVVNVVDIDRLRHGSVTPNAQETAEQEAELATAALAATETMAGSVTHVEVCAGPAAGCLIDYAVSIDADLIVVGNRRVQGIERLLGSVAVEVLRHAPCSVHVAHTV